MSCPSLRPMARAMPRLRPPPSLLAPRSSTTACLRRQSTAPANPLLASLRADLKTAMRAKDTPRLSVLRVMLAGISNSAHTSAPITSSPQLLAFLRKEMASTTISRDEFASAGRQDLVDKEDGQLRVLEEYAENLKGGMLGDDQIRDAVNGVVAGLKAAHGAAEGSKLAMGDVLRAVMAKLEGKDVEKKEVVRMVKEVVDVT